MKYLKEVFEKVGQPGWEVIGTRTQGESGSEEQ